MEWSWNDIEARVSDAAEYGAQMTRTIITTEIRSVVDAARYESPIEAVFAAWWMAASSYRGVDELYLQPQVEVSVHGECFRLDFEVAQVIHPSNYGSGIYTPFPRIAIELDGHDFHERTKEQVTQRNRRDRLLQDAGWRVLHVSGSELFRSPREVVSECIQTARTAMGEFWTAYWAEHNKRQMERRIE